MEYRLFSKNETRFARRSRQQEAGSSAFVHVDTTNAYTFDMGRIGQGL